MASESRESDGSARVAESVTFSVTARIFDHVGVKALPRVSVQVRLSHTAAPETTAITSLPTTALRVPLSTAKP